MNRAKPLWRPASRGCALLGGVLLLANCFHATRRPALPTPVELVGERAFPLYWFGADGTDRTGLDRRRADHDGAGGGALQHGDPDRGGARGDSSESGRPVLRCTMVRHLHATVVAVRADTMRLHNIRIADRAPDASPCPVSGALARAGTAADRSTGTAFVVLLGDGSVQARTSRVSSGGSVAFAVIATMLSGLFILDGALQ